jgi:hypothetical protein
MVKANLFIEAQANTAGMATNALEKLIEDLRSEGVTIRDYEILEEESEVIDDKETFSSFVEMSVDMELRDFLRLSMRITPTSMEVYEAPKKLESKDAMYLMADMCKVIGTMCQRAGVRLPVPQTQFGDERQEGPGITDEEYEEFIDKGYIHFKFVTNVAGDEQIIKRDILRVLNVLGAYVNNIKLKEEGDQSKGFVGLAAVDAVVPDVEVLFELALRFSPVALSVEEPETLPLSEIDVQNLAINLSALVSDITNYITSKNNRLMPNGN